MRTVVTVALLLLEVSGCRPAPDTTVIAVLTATPTSSLADDPGRSAFTERVESRCPACVVRFRAEGVTPEDLAQVREQGADVVVVEALTADQGEALAAAAGTLPLIAFDRYFAGADFYVSYDLAAVGPLVSDVVATSVDGSQTALLVDGSSLDTDLDVLEDSLRDGLADGGVEIAAELDAATGTSEETRAWVQDRLEDRVGRRSAPWSRSATSRPSA